MIHRVKDLPLLGELHLGLGGMDVDIHRRHRHRHRQDTAGKLALHDLVAVALFQCRRQQLGLDETAVDEEHLHGTGTAAHQGRRHEAFHGHLAAAALHRHQRLGEVTAQGGIDGRLQLPVAGSVEALCAVLDELKGNIGMRQRQMLHQSRHSGGLGTVLFHELQPGGGVVEQVPHDHGGALRGAGGLYGSGNTALQMERGAVGLALLAGQDLHAADGGDGSQSFPSEAQRADPAQVVRAAHLGGGVAQKGRGQLLSRDTAAVVADTDHAHAAPLDLHRHSGRARVNGVLHQFLDDTGGALHHFARGDQVRNMRGQLLNLRHLGHLLRFRIKATWRSKGSSP